MATNYEFCVLEDEKVATERAMLLATLHSKKNIIIIGGAGMSTSAGGMLGSLTLGKY